MSTKSRYEALRKVPEEFRKLTNAEKLQMLKKAGVLGDDCKLTIHAGGKSELSRLHVELAE